MSDKKGSHDPALARVIEKQVRNWEISRAQRVENRGTAPEDVAHFITIANIVGAGGSEIAEGLAERLGWPIFDRDILTTMAGDDEVRTRLYRSMDERDVGWVESVFRSLMQEEFRKDDYFHRLTETILFLARQGSAIFVGRSADLILPKHKGLRVKVIATRQHCAANFAKRMGISPEQALNEVERIEGERRAFVQHHFHIDAYEPTRFDLLVNVEMFTSAEAIEMILAAARSRGITKASQVTTG